MDILCRTLACPFSSYVNRINNTFHICSHASAHTLRKLIPYIKTALRSGMAQYFFSFLSACYDIMSARRAKQYFQMIGERRSISRCTPHYQRNQRVNLYDTEKEIRKNPSVILNRAVNSSSAVGNRLCSVLTLNPALGTKLFEDRTLFILCTAVDPCII